MIPSHSFFDIAICLVSLMGALLVCFWDPFYDELLAREEQAALADTPQATDVSSLSGRFCWQGTNSRKG